jgi:hypothetical protein
MPIMNTMGVNNTSAPYTIFFLRSFVLWEAITGATNNKLITNPAITP